MATFLTNIDLKGNQLLNAVVQNLAVAPASPKEGQVYYDTTEKAVKVYADGSWQAVGSSEGASELTAEAVANYVRDNKEAFKGHVEQVLTAEKVNRLLDDWAVEDQANSRDSETYVLNGLKSAIVQGSISAIAPDLLPFLLDGAGVSTLASHLSPKMTEVAQAEVAKLVASAPEELNTFEEIAAAIKANKDALAQIANTAKVYREELNFSTTPSVELVHNLGQRAVAVTLYDAQGNQVLADVSLVSETTAQVTVSESFTETLTAVVVG